MSNHRSKRLRPVDVLYQRAARDPRAIAVVAPGEPLTYSELTSAVDALAAALQGLDPVVGSRIGICARNTPEHLLALLATYAAGKVWVPLNPRNGRAELDAMIAVTQPSLIIADESCLDRFSTTAAPVILGKTERVSGDSRLSVWSLVETWRGKHADVVRCDATDVQIIKFSGGSTGTPKAVLQSVRCLDAQARGLLEFFEFTAADVNLIAAPLTHGTSCFVLPILAAGGRHVLVEEPKASTILDAIVTHGVTTLYAPPTLIYSLLAEAAVNKRSYPALRHLIYSAAPMNAARIREAQRVFGPAVETAYGQVEAPQIVTAMRASELMEEENIASVGRASSVARVATMSENGELLPPGETGEIVVQGPLLMSGYLDRPDLTAQTIRHGWLHTGDLGVIDDRGYLYIRGRLREIINTGGFKVLPGDVEAVLARHPAVAECCVFGAVDEKWGEAVHAAVRLEANASASAAELIAYVKRELDSVKAPKAIHFVDALPRNAAGKVSRVAVSALALESERPKTPSSSLSDESAVQIR